MENPKNLIGESLAPWSNGAFCAVSIAYVGGLDEHVDLAVPLLRQLDLPATFFLDPLNVIDSVRVWEPLRATRHELGLAPFGDADACRFLSGWTQGAFGDEIRSAKRFLREVFGTDSRSVHHDGFGLYGENSSFGSIIENEFENVVTSVPGQNSPLTSTHQLRVLTPSRYPLAGLSEAFRSEMPTWIILPFFGLFEGDYSKILTHRLLVEAIGRERSRLRIGTVSEIAEEVRRRQSPVN